MMVRMLFCSVMVNLVVLIASSSAQVVAEWKFDLAEDQPAGAVIPLDRAATGGSSESVLMDATTYSAGSTGITDKWQSFLSTGYIDVGPGAGSSSADKWGLVTKATNGRNHQYTAYMGFRGLGMKDKGQGGTVYLVVQPNDDWQSRRRRGLMGAGYGIGKPFSPGVVSILVVGGELKLQVGRGEEPTHTGHEAPVEDFNGDGQTNAFVWAESVASLAWNPEKWYFIAASWQEGSAPVVYVREMSPDGAAASPEAVLGTATPAGAANGKVVDTVPTMTNGPEYSPLCVGARWIDHGSAKSEDGADAKIAYVRFDNVFTSAQDMAKVFEALDAKAVAAE